MSAPRMFFRSALYFAGIVRMARDSSPPVVPSSGGHDNIRFTATADNISQSVTPSAIFPGRDSEPPKKQRYLNVAKINLGPVYSSFPAPIASPSITKVPHHVSHRRQPRLILQN